MKMKWIKTAHKGLRYYEHPTTRHGKKKDRYYAIRFKVAGKEYSYGAGWLSDGIPEAIRKAEPELGFEEYCLKLLREYKGNVKTGTGPKSPKQRRAIEEAREAAERQEAERLEKEAVTFGAFFTDSYLPQSKADKKQKTATREEGLYDGWIASLPVIIEREDGEKRAVTLKDLPLKDVTPFHLEKLKKSMADGGQSPRSIQYALAVVRQVFNAARRHAVFNGDNPTAKVKFPKPDNGRMRFLTHKEADKLLEALKGKSMDVHDMTLLSLHCGLRFGEISALTWQDVDTKSGTLTIRNAKAGSRYAFLTEQAAAMLKGRKKKKPADYVFRKRGGGKLIDVSHTFSRVISDLKLNKGIDDPRLKICFHSCRHSYASWLIEEGADLYTVQKLLGHKTNVMTQRYAHLSEKKLRDTARALSLALRTPEADTGEVVELRK